MGLVSHILFSRKVFKSSLIFIDGSFFFRSIKKNASTTLTLGVGLFIHLVTSGVFGAIYPLAWHLINHDAKHVKSLCWTGIYFTFLWFSMLFIALPISGEGLLGKKSGPYSWAEQLILHLVFWLVYNGCVNLLLE
jgi:hypothetical protein